MNKFVQKPIPRKQNFKIHLEKQSKRLFREIAYPRVLPQIIQSEAKNRENDNEKESGEKSKINIMLSDCDVCEESAEAEKREGKR